MVKKITHILSGLGLLVGVIVGAGMFALPYAVAQAGIFWGFVHMSVAFLMSTTMHLLYGDVAYETKGKHRLPGYARMYLGNGGARTALLASLFGMYGALLVYGILGGVFLSTLFSTAHTAMNNLSLMFFAVGSAFLIFNLDRIGGVNFLLSAVLVIFVGALAYFTAPYARLAEVPFANNDLWFLPYGIFLFAFGGVSAIPDVADVFRKTHKKIFRRVVVLSTIIPFIIYAVFILSILGVTNGSATKDALSGLGAALGEGAVFIGSLIGLIAVFTSYLTLGADIKNIYILDYGWRRVSAWVAVMIVPVGLFLLGMSDFIKTLGIVGAVAIGTEGLIILGVSLKVRASLVRRALVYVLGAALFFGIVYELYTFFNI